MEWIVTVEKQDDETTIYRWEVEADNLIEAEFKADELIERFHVTTGTGVAEDTLRVVVKREDPQIILNKLLTALWYTRAGGDLMSLQYHPNQEMVSIVYNSGYSITVNVACDSGIAMIRDVLQHIE